MAERATSSPEEGQPTTQVFECAVCLQNCIHPVRLPCGHIFCFLCMKGVALQSKRCALCRTEIHAEYFNNPILVRQDDLLKDTSFEDGNWWYYEGRNGWWQYDERTSQEIEDQYKQGTKAFELLIAGFLYVIDLESMVQYRRNDPFRRRRVKRDLTSIPKKGVAGLKILSPVPCRSSGDGDETRDSGAQRVAPVPVSSSPTRVVTDANANGANSTSTSPPQPTNPPNTRDCSPPGPSEDQTDDLATVISRLQLSPATQNQQSGNLANNGNSQDPNSFDYSDTSDEDWS